MKRFLSMLTCVVFACTLFACQAQTTTLTIPDCEWGFTETVHEEIPIVSVTAAKSTVVGSPEYFADVCKPVDQHPLLFKNALVKTHQVIFAFDAIYPLEDLSITGYVGEEAATIATVSVDVSLSGYAYDRAATDVSLSDGSGTIDLTGHSAKFVRIVFPAVLGVTHGLQDVRFHLGSGFIVRESAAWTAALLRTSGWSGADGIFSFNLNGDDSIGAANPNTAFYFSDTFVGNVNPDTMVRQNPVVMINNSIGYYDGNADIAAGFSFAYRTEGGVKSAFLPDAYTGYHPNNLLDSDGLSSYLDPDATIGDTANGVMWLSDKLAENYVQVDFGATRSLGRLTIWNYNENPAYGVENVRVLTSLDGDVWTAHPDATVPAASGTAGEHASLSVLLPDTDARYVRLLILSSRHAEKVGLGKLLFEDFEGEPLFGQMAASDYDPTVTGNELSSRLWLQDGVVLDGHLYIFPLLVKDEANFFKVTRVGMVKAAITGGVIDYENAEYLSTPLQSKTPDGGVLYYGAGVMDHVSTDGYVYVYGYKDKAGRHLIVARVIPESIEDFTAWRYWDGTEWSKDVNDSAPLLEGVSCELSVAKIDTGLLAGKYMLVAMEGTTSGKVSYAVADQPWGPFSSFTVLYEATESETLRGAFTYNAKMHVHLSQPGEYLITYNVNTSVLSALYDANIYHPRFLVVTETKQPD